LRLFNQVHPFLVTVLVNGLNPVIIGFPI
jgi:hypothetical protein